MALQLQAVVSLNSSQFGKGIGKLQQGVSNATGAMAMAFGGVTAEILMMGRAFGPVGAAVAVLKSVVAVGAPLESSMAQVAGVTGLYGDQLERVTRNARDMAKTTKFTANEAAQALYALGSAGLSTADDLESTLEPVLKLAGATMSETGMVAESITSTIQNLGLEFSDSTKVADRFAAAIAKSPVTMERMADAIKFAAPVAGAFGMSLDQLTTELAAFHLAGFKGTMAGTAFRNVMLDLAKKAEEGSGKVGKALKNWEAGTEGITGAVERLERKGVTSQEVMLELGKRAGTGLAGMMNLGSIAIKKLALSMDGAKTAAEMYELQMATLEGQTARFKSAMEEVGLQIYDVLRGPMTGIVSTLADMASGLGDFLAYLAADPGEAFFKLGVDLVDLVDRFNEFLELDAGDLWSNFKDAGVQAFADIQDFFRGDFWTNLMDALAETASIAFDEIKDTFTGDWWEPLLDTFVDVWDEIIRVGKDLLGQLWSILVDIDWQGAWNQLKFAASMVMLQVLQNLISWTKQIGKVFTNINWAGLWKDLADVAGIAFDAVRDVFKKGWWKPLLDTFINTWKVIRVLGRGFIRAMMKRIKKIDWQGAWNQMKFAFWKVLNTIFRALKPWIDAVTKKFKAIDWKELWKDVWFEFGKALRKATKKVVQWFKEAKEYFGKKGPGLWDKLKTAADFVWKAITVAFHEFMRGLLGDKKAAEFFAAWAIMWDDWKKKAEDTWAELFSAWDLTKAVWIEMGRVMSEEVWPEAFRLWEQAKPLFKTLMSGMTLQVNVLVAALKAMMKIWKWFGEKRKEFKEEHTEAKWQEYLNDQGFNLNGGELNVNIPEFKGVANELTLKTILTTMLGMKGLIWSEAV